MSKEAADGDEPVVVDDESKDVSAEPSATEKLVETDVLPNETDAAATENSASQTEFAVDDKVDAEEPSNCENNNTTDRITDNNSNNIKTVNLTDSAGDEESSFKTPAAVPPPPSDDTTAPKEVATQAELRRNGDTTSENVSTVLNNQNRISDVATSQDKKTVPIKPAGQKLTRPTKKYVYSLKAKSGRVLRYTSTVPIVLKKPVIKLTKMDETKFQNSTNEVEDEDSDNSMKENNIKKNDETKETSRANVVKKKGRPPLSQRPPVITLDGNSSDNDGGKEEQKPITTPSTGMQTRKRQLKFLPDGRIITPGKKSKRESDTMSSDSDIIETDDDSDYKTNKKNTPASTKKFERITNEKKGKFKKVFDYESFFREKSNSMDTSDTGKSKLANKTIEKNTSVASPAIKKATVDPAQLLSSLIGVPIYPNQLNVVKFKPKVIQERLRPAITKTPEISLNNTRLSKPITPSLSETSKSSPFKVVSKQTFQKILPKPTTAVTVTPIAKKVVENRISATSTPVSVLSPKVMPFRPKVVTTPDTTSCDDVISKFGGYTDTRVVKTRAGPKKMGQKKNEDDSSKTVYDLVSNVFDKMPSWNLHIIPDTNSFCISQVARGRMGIPILKKSIELNAEFFAKVYVHQLHCKRYDGVYDTESKILSLIKDIDSLAA